MKPEAPQPPKIGTGYSCPKCGNTGDQKCGHPEAALVPACSICRRTDHPLADNGLCWECWSNHPELQESVAAQPTPEAARTTSIPHSNMDDLTVKDEGDDVVFYDCRGDVAHRFAKRAAEAGEPQGETKS